MPQMLGLQGGECLIFDTFSEGWTVFHIRFKMLKCLARLYKGRKVGSIEDKKHGREQK